MAQPLLRLSLSLHPAFPPLLLEICPEALWCYRSVLLRIVSTWDMGREINVTHRKLEQSSYGSEVLGPLFVMN